MGVRDFLSTGGKIGAKSYPWRPTPCQTLGWPPRPPRPSCNIKLCSVLKACPQTVSGQPLSRELGEVTRVDREVTGGG